MKLQKIKEALSKSFKERGELIDGMLTALLAGEMLFMIGQPGTAKSAICNCLCNVIDGKYFTWLMSKFTTPEEVFGPLSLKQLENDKYERVITNKLPEADIAFLDEIFKGSSAILNTLLPVINERVFFNGTIPVNVPLKVMFGASNEIPQAEELAALYDRFALRYEVPRIQSDTAAKELFDEVANFKAPPFVPKMSMAELEAEQQAVRKVKVPEKIIDIIVALRRSVEQEGIFTSDRRWVQALRILRAYAHLNGANEVAEDHLSILRHVLWSSPEQQRSVARLVNKFSNPLGEAIMQITDAVQDMMNLLNKREIPAVEAQKKVRHAQKQLEQLGDASGNKKLADAIEQVKKINLQICREHLGIE